MLKVFRDAFKISFDNLILFTPPLVFMMLVLLYFGMAEKYKAENGQNGSGNRCFRKIWRRFIY